LSDIDRGNLFVVAAPSGAGKTSLVNALIEKTASAHLSVSHTTRAPRPGEVDGVHYHFVDRPGFEQMVAADEGKRITTVKYDNSLPVVAAVDLGWSDAMVVGFWQTAGTEHRCLAAKAYHHTSVPDMIQDWKDNFEFPIDTVVLPHDARVHELGSGKTRQEVFHDQGCRTTICPGQKIHEGIAAVLQILPHMWFDKERTSMLREALLAYRSEFDEVKEVHRVTPVHDWSSHWADMVRYYALGRPMGNIWGPQGTFEGGY